MKIYVHGNDLNVEINEDSCISAKYCGGDWIVTFIMESGFCTYSCSEKFSSKTINDDDILEKANLLRQAWKYLELDTLDDALVWGDETIMPIVNKIILENNGQIKLNL